jgi:acyl transferase domain-containing protein/SAM-dependent methyltransferase/NAD(P)-dependent dehydrogenase (short-subunit alcohol dehydrogenase family)/aryl carrier-like protein
MTAAMSAEGILSQEGSCKTFDSGADGFARGEAVVAVYLQLLDRAVQQRLPIRAVVANSDVNSNGRSNNILQPRAAAQIALMKKVYGDIGAETARTAYVECHGTGTPTGDPIETEAIGQVFGNHGVYIGSLKPNMGHSEAASGISSLLKSIVMLEKSMIVPNIKFKSPNPKINFEKYKLRVPQELIPWPRDRDLRISINSFGIGGSNAHVIVEHPYMHLSTLDRTSTLRLGSPQLLLMSAATQSSLRVLEKRYGAYTKTHPDRLPELAYTLARRREHLQLRTYSVHVEGCEYESAPIMKTPSDVPEVTMIFNGQGAQWTQMGRELLDDNNYFSEAIDFMDSVLKGLKFPPKWSIRAELQKPSEISRVHAAEMSQPLCTALQIGLVDVFAAAGIKPGAVVGHSSGEIAAGYASGAIGMAEAITIAYYRGFIMKDIAKDGASEGGMAAIGLDAARTHQMLRPGVVIACENSPNSTTISGDHDVITQILEEIEKHSDGVFARRLKVEVAYHSHHMEALANIYLDLLREELNERDWSRADPLVPMFSSVMHQDRVLSAADLTVQYWVTNLVTPVKFHTAMSNALRSKGNNLLLEIGPHSALAGPLREICSSMKVSFNYCPAMVRFSHSTHRILTVFGTLYQHGFPIAWQCIIPDSTILTDLPPYPWDHTRSFWYESRVAKAWRSRKFGHHELLGLRAPQTTDNNPVWRVMLHVDDVPWLMDHKVKGNVVFPFAAYISMAGEAYRQISGREGGYTARRVEVSTAMVLDEERPLEVVTSLHACSPTDGEASDPIFKFVIASYSGSTWIQHCKGVIGGPLNLGTALSVNRTLPRHVNPKAWYGSMARLGLEYGPNFQGISTMSSSTQENLAVAEVLTFPGPHKGAYTMHPTTIDAVFQVGLVALTKGLTRNFREPQIPTSIEELEVRSQIRSINCCASYSPGKGELSVDVVTMDGTPCLHLRGMRLTALGNDDQVGEKDRYGGARLHWVPDTDFQDLSSLIKIPALSNRDKQLIEELALLCILESDALLKDLNPSAPHLSKYRAWVEWVAREALDGKHPILGDTSALVSTTQAERHSRMDDIRQETSSSSSMAAFAEATMRTYNAIQQLFIGQMDPLELLLRNNNLARIYDAVSFNYSNLVSAFSNTVPNLRILEVGAGTGGSTELILRGMQQYGQFSQYSKYTFTDISAGFFSSARERFSFAPNMEFSVLDISQNPLQQGFEPDSYDIILAANVVHATPSLSETLRNLQILLAPRGRLVLTEFCTSFRAPNYIYGNFSGWWLGQGDDREWEPYVNVDRWDQELRAVGLNGASTVVLDSEDPWQYCATIISQKPVERKPLEKEVSILCRNPEANVVQDHLLGLEKDGLEPRCVASHNGPHADGDIISTLDLEANFFENISEQDLSYFQKLCGSLGDRTLLWLTPPARAKCVNPRASQSLGMIGTARSELDLSIATLEIDSSIPGFVKFTTDVFQKLREGNDNNFLAPDREFLIDDNVVKVGRYRPFDLHHELKIHSTTPIGYPHFSDTAKNAKRRVSPDTQLNFDSNITYMMTGGLGGLGRAIAVWMAEKGASHLLFLSPSAGTRLEHQRLFTELESMGCNVLSIQGTAQNEDDVEKATKAAKTPIRGVLHLAMQLNDASVLDISYNNWTTVISPKVDGAWNLHKLLGNGLDFFVMASSLGTVFHQAGQSNYNAANSFLEAFCQYRHSLQLPASVLNICPIEDIGYVAENREARRTLKSQGHWFLDERALLEFLELAILHSKPFEQSGRTRSSRDDATSWCNNSQIIMGLRSEIPLEDPANRSTWRYDRRMGLYHNIIGDQKVQATSNREGLRTFIARVANQPDLLSQESSRAYLAAEVGKRIFSFIMRSEDEMDESLTLVQVRLDSLMAIELRRWWKQVFSVEISVLEILSAGTIGGLGEVAVRNLQKRFSHPA